MLNYNSVANYNIVDYLRNNGIETQLPPISDFFGQEMINYDLAAKNRFSHIWIKDYIMGKIIKFAINYNTLPVIKIMKKFKFYDRRPSVTEIAENAKSVFSLAFNSGEGWLLPGEIIAMIKKGIKSFVIVQPFGCLPNHISGKGIIKAIKEKYNDVQIISLDYDPDISIGNIENRLQMLIMTAKEMNRKTALT